MDRLVRASLTVLLLLLAVPGAASAYTDPGSGALILQALAAGVVGAMFYTRRIIGFVRRIAGKSQATDVRTDS